MINPKKYVVLDVETNGLSSQRDDLLSISIYKPDDGKTYNRFLPLELQNYVETTWINGITEEMLENMLPLSQKEFDDVIRLFELEKRIILTYGNIDEKFIKKYLSRHKINGFEKLTFYNFKHDIISSHFSGGNITKDNLCRVYGIDNISNIHSGLNDCILEWKLFEKMNGNKLIVINDFVYEFNNEYMIPASYLQNYTNFKYCINDYPKINYEMKLIRSFRIRSKELQKFDTNISGMMIEHLINTMLNVKDMSVEALPFQIANKSKLKKLGNLPSVFHQIDAIFNKDGTVTAVRKEDKKRVEDINKVTLIIKEKIKPLIKYIKKEIFKNDIIMSQELVINNEDNVMASCDLSTKDAILEIKAYDGDIDKFKYQLYYEARGRDIYILQSSWYFEAKKGLDFKIYKVEPCEYTEKDYNLDKRKSKFEKKINNPDIHVIEYNGYGKNLKLKCLKCDNEWDSSYNLILKHNLCPKCNPIIKKEKKSKPVMTTEEKQLKRKSAYQFKVDEKSLSTIQVKDYTGSKDPVKLRCFVCNHEWVNGRADHFLERCYCPRCKSNQLYRKGNE